MTKTLILVFHPDLSRSKVNKALVEAAAGLPGVEIADIQALYPKGIELARDGAAEAARLLSADRIVLQFPFQWYYAPAILKAWQDAVLTRMFYMTYEHEGRALEGTPLLIAATVGNLSESFRPGGQNIFTMDALLAPLRATANRCGLGWTKPFVVYQADKLEPPLLQAAAADYADTLKAWISASPAHSR